jgi:outer membrane protein OmpA-like peptidoglycan-associated protein
VRKALIARGIDAARLDARGFGEDQLSRPDRPNDRANRRVEIRNLGAAPR